MAAVAPAPDRYIDPDADGHYHLRIAGETKTFAVEEDEQGPYLVEILPWESLPEEARRVLEEQERNPRPLVRRPRRRPGG